MILHERDLNIPTQTEQKMIEAHKEEMKNFLKTVEEKTKNWKKAANPLKKAKKAKKKNQTGEGYDSNKGTSYCGCDIAS